MFLKSIQHLSLGNDDTSADKNIVIGTFFFFKILCKTYTMQIKNTHLKKDRDKSRIL